MLADAVAIAALLALAVLRPHGFDAHGEQLLDRVLDLRLGRREVDLEAVGVVPRALVRALFGDQRPQDDLVRLQLKSGLPSRSGLALRLVFRSRFGRGRVCMVVPQSACPLTLWRPLLVAFLEAAFVSNSRFGRSTQ